jgi:penicillin G amidase
VQDDYTTAALEAYARGVNAWLDIVNEEALGRGAPEFWLFSARDRALDAGRQPRHRQAHGAAPVRPSSRTRCCAPGSRSCSPTTACATSCPTRPARRSSTCPSSPRSSPTRPPSPRPNGSSDPLDPAPARGFGGASNAWAAAPGRSAAGGTLLASDPHLAFSAPSIWYLAALDLETGGVIGATIPGMPAVFAGRSERLGWAPTSSYLDDQDLYIERMNPDESRRGPDARGLADRSAPAPRSST